VLLLISDSAQVSIFKKFRNFFFGTLALLLTNIFKLILFHFSLIKLLIITNVSSHFAMYSFL
jgi:hypothetical protein